MFSKKAILEASVYLLGDEEIDEEEFLAIYEIVTMRRKHPYKHYERIEDVFDAISPEEFQTEFRFGITATTSPSPSIKNSRQIYLLQWYGISRGRVGGYSTKFHTGRLFPELQPLTLLYTEKVPLLYTSNWKMVTLSHSCFSAKYLNLLSGFNFFS